MLFTCITFSQGLKQCLTFPQNSLKPNPTSCFCPCPSLFSPNSLFATDLLLVFFSFYFKTAVNMICRHKIMTSSRMSALTIQHYIGASRQYSKAKNECVDEWKRHPDWKGGSKIVIIHRHDKLCRKSDKIHKKKLLELTSLEKSQDTRSVESILLSFYILARSNQKLK